MSTWQKIEILNNRLSDFGLNPTEWRCIEESESSVKIENLEDPNLVLIGEAGPKDLTWDWIKLEFASYL